MPRLNLPKMKQGGETGRIDKSKMCETCGKKHANYGLKVAREVFAKRVRMAQIVVHWYPLISAIFTFFFC